MPLLKHLIEDGEIQENTPETHAWFEDFHDFYTEINPEAFTVGEAWTDTEKVVEYIGDEVDIAFEFDHAGAILQTAQRESALFVEGSQKQIVKAYPPGQYATFITNHDQERIMSVLLGNVGRAKTAASLLLTGPGVPFIYYGEEVGQSGRKPDENIRTPMQWADEPNAGFTTADRAWRSPQGNYDDFNVAEQTAVPDSHLRQRDLRSRPSQKRRTWRIQSKLRQWLDNCWPVDWHTRRKNRQRLHCILHPQHDRCEKLRHTPKTQ